jgi:hypothetical protein
LLWETSPSCQARSGREDAEEEGERGRAEQAVGVDRHDAAGQRMQVADGLVGDVVGGVPLLAISRLVDAQDEGRVPDCLAQQLEPLGPQIRDRPLGLGQKMVQRLRVGVHGLAQPRQRLVPRLGQQSQVERGEVLEVAHILEEEAVLGTVLVDESHRRGGRARLAHAEPPFAGSDLQTVYPT